MTDTDRDALEKLAREAKAFTEGKGWPPSLPPRSTTMGLLGAMTDAVLSLMAERDGLLKTLTDLLPAALWAMAAIDAPLKPEIAAAVEAARKLLEETT